MAEAGEEIVSERSPESEGWWKRVLDRLGGEGEKPIGGGFPKGLRDRAGQSILSREHEVAVGKELEIVFG